MQPVVYTKYPLYFYSSIQLRMLSKKDKIEILGIALNAASLITAKASTNNSEPFIFLEQCSEITGYSKNTIYSLISKKEIPYHKLAGRQKLLFRTSELLAWMNSKKKVEVVNE